MTALVLFAVALSSQGNEDDFWRIEEAIKTAKSLSLQVRKESTITEEGKVYSLKWSGSVLVKGGSKLIVSLSEADAPDNPLQIICNEKHVVVRNIDSNLVTHKAIEGLSNGVLLAITRGQVDFWLTDTARRLNKGDLQPSDWKSRLKIANLRQSDPDGKARTLTYDVKLDGDSMHFKVWYDPTTYFPIKRSYESKGERLSAQGVEFYENLILGGEIPDSKFATPTK